MTLFGILQFGLAIWNYNMLSSLAQEGARWAAVRGSECSCTPEAKEGEEDEVETYVRSRVVGMNPTSVTVLTTWPDGGTPSNAPGKTVQVRVEYTFSLFSRIVGIGDVPLRGTAQMKIAR